MSSSFSPAALEQQADRRRRTDAHDLRRHADGRRGNQARQRLAAPVAFHRARGHQRGHRRIGQRRAVAAGLHAVLEHRAQLGQHLGRRDARVRVAVGHCGLAREADAARLVAGELEHFVRHRHDLAVEEAGLLRRHGTREGLGGEGVDLLARDAVLLRQVLGGLDHRDRRRGIGQRLPQVVLELRRHTELETLAVLEGGDRVACHRLGADHQRQAGRAGGNLLAGLAEQLEAGAADALHHDRAHLAGHAGVQADVARHVELVEAARRHVAGEHRVDGLGLHAGALDDLARHLDAQVDRVGVGEGAAVVDHRRAHAAEDPGVVEGLEEAAGHGFAPVRWRVRRGSRVRPARRRTTPPPRPRGGAVRRPG